MNQVAVERVAFIGLGVMGYPMAGHLAAKGYQVTVFNRTEAKANQWVSEHGGSSAATPAEAARDAQAVFACVGNDDDIRAVTMGPDGAFNGMSKGAVFIDHTTASAEVARELYDEAKSRGLEFLDGPVSGGQAGAENGVLTVMVGGDQSPVALDIARKRLDAEGIAYRFADLRDGGFEEASEPASSSAASMPEDDAPPDAARS